MLGCGIHIPREGLREAELDGSSASHRMFHRMRWPDAAGAGVRPKYGCPWARSTGAGGRKRTTFASGGFQVKPTRTKKSPQARDIFGVRKMKPFQNVTVTVIVSV